MLAVSVEDEGLWREGGGTAGWEGALCHPLWSWPWRLAGL